MDCINFCTKNPEPMLERLDEIRQYRQLWFVTITPYGREIEPQVPEKERVMGSFKRLSKKTGIHASLGNFFFLGTRRDIPTARSTIAWDIQPDTSTPYASSSVPSQQVRIVIPYFLPIRTNSFPIMILFLLRRSILWIFISGVLRKWRKIYMVM